MKILTILSNTIYNTREWPQDFTEVTMIALKKKTKSTKCSDYRIISLIAHTAKIIAKILRRRIEKKIEDVKLNPGLPWQKLHLTRRRIFLPANWT